MCFRVDIGKSRWKISFLCVGMVVAIVISEMVVVVVVIIEIRVMIISIL